MTTEIDEQSIRREVEDREYRIDVTEDWRTPSGNRRKAPMFTATIGNDYLPESRLIKARSPQEVVEKAEKLFTTWAKREISQRVADEREDLRERAEQKTAQAEEEIEELRNTLSATLDVDDRINWDSLLDTRVYEPEHFSGTGDPPSEPARRILSYLWPPLWKRMREAHEQRVRSYEARSRALKVEHDRAQVVNRLAIEKARDEKNRSIRLFQEAFERGEPSAVVEYVTMVFERSQYPERMQPASEVHFDLASETVVVDLSIPGPDDFPDVYAYKLADRNSRIAPVSLKKKDRDDLYDEATKQLTLRAAHEVLEAVYIPHVQSVVVNTWTAVTDPATGHDRTSCILSVSTGREEFEALQLSRVDATECIKSLKGLIAGPLAQVAPVRPIMTFNRDDPRFIESQDVLAEINSMTNLAEIPWEEFEHLVRGLFSKMFSTEDSEVRITQASRDGGVDAVAFDPDPIRGGKFVIQAKRYTKAVPAGSVRELYGTMLNEGASKGILVTTASYGRQAREFAKDKPITLVDGSNLVYLLEQHGHRVRIDLEAAKASRQGSSS